jgi:hypothetical protein
MWRSGDEVKARGGGGGLQRRLSRRAFCILAAGAGFPCTAAEAEEGPAGRVRLELAGPPVAFTLALAGGEAVLGWTGGLQPIRWPAVSARLLGVFPLAGREVASFLFTPPGAAPALDLTCLLIVGSDGRDVGILDLELWHWAGREGAWLSSTLDAPGGGVELRLVRYAHPPGGGPAAVSFWTDHLFWQEGGPLVARFPRPPPPASWQGRLAQRRERLRSALTPLPRHLTEDLLAESGFLDPARLFAENRD